MSVDAQTRTGTYLYGVVAAGSLDAEALAAEPSVDGQHAVRLVTVGELAAIVSDVPLDEFDETALPARLNDLNWLEETARAHESVLERALAAAAVVPFRFCTIYRDEDDLRGFVAERADALARVLDRVEGCVELGVRALVDHRRLEGELAAAGEGDAAADASGRSYLLRRQRERRLALETAEFLRDCASAAHARLEAEALAAAELPVRTSGAGDTEAMFLNGAYLVRAADEALAREATRLEAEYARFGIRFELTGPWPPYNFVPRDAAAA